MVEIDDVERGTSYEQLNYSNSKYGEHASGHIILSPSEGRICHYCDLKKCPCCLYQSNYYYNYGLSRRKITLCIDCFSEVYGSGRKLSTDIVTRAFTRICESIMNSAMSTTNFGNRENVDYFNAVKRAFGANPEVRAYLGENSNIDKNLRALWSFTYSIVNGQHRGIMVLNSDPDNLELKVDFEEVCHAL